MFKQLHRQSKCVQNSVHYSELCWGNEVNCRVKFSEVQNAVQPITVQSGLQCSGYCCIVKYSEECHVVQCNVQCSVVYITVQCTV